MTYVFGDNPFGPDEKAKPQKAKPQKGQPTYDDELSAMFSRLKVVGRKKRTAKAKPKK